VTIIWKFREPQPTGAQESLQELLYLLVPVFCVVLIKNTEYFRKCVEIYMYNVKWNNNLFPVRFKVKDLIFYASSYIEKQQQ